MNNKHISRATSYLCHPSTSTIEHPQHAEIIHSNCSNGSKQRSEQNGRSSTTSRAEMVNLMCCRDVIFQTLQPPTGDLCPCGIVAGEEQQQA